MITALDQCTEGHGCSQRNGKGKVIKQTMFINEHYGYAELQRIVYKQKEIDDNKISTCVLHVKSHIFNFWAQIL